MAIQLFVFVSPSVDSDLDELEGKGTKRPEAPNPSQKVANNTNDGHAESFDDFDNILYGR